MKIGDKVGLIGMHKKIIDIGKIIGFEDDGKKAIVKFPHDKYPTIVLIGLLKLMT